jgi:hypothetical protein
MPFACIHRRSHGASTYCGRNFEPEEFVFHDVDSAVAHYDTWPQRNRTKTTLVACSACVDGVKRVRLAENEERRK